MKKLLAIFVGVAVVAFCSAALAETVLSDKQLGELYAAYGNGGGIEINKLIDLQYSAAVAQSNIAGVVVNKGGEVGDEVEVKQCNIATVNNNVDYKTFACTSTTTNNDNDTTTINTTDSFNKTATDSFNKTITKNDNDTFTLTKKEVDVDVLKFVAIDNSDNSSSSTSTSTTTTTKSIDDINAAIGGSNIATTGGELYDVNAFATKGGEVEVD